MTDLASIMGVEGATKNAISELTPAQAAEFLELSKEWQKRQDYSGHHKWYDPTGPYSLLALPKHRAIIQATKIYKEVLVMGGNRCHAAGTSVWMADGTEKSIEDVLVGEEVLAYDIKKKALVPTVVVDTFAGIADNVRRYYTPVSNREIFSTTDHPFMRMSQTGKTYLSKAEDFRYWDKVMIPTKWEIEGTDPGFSINVAKLLGLLVGDGHLAAKEDRFKLTSGTPEVIDFAKEVAREELGLDPRSYSYGDRGYTDLYFPKKEKRKGKSSLALLLIRMGLYGKISGNKFVPKEILLAPEAHVRAFIQGLLAADGHYSKGRIQLYTTSQQLAKTFAKACLRLGVYTNESVKKHKNPNHADCYIVSISGDSNLKLIGDSFHKHPILRGTERQKKDSRGVAFKKGEIQPKQEIYCITVHHPDHLFVANGYIGSNTGKTKIGTYMSAVHGTGDYPKGWEGRVIDHPVAMWSVGKSKETVRDTLQESLLGPQGALGTGMIARELIGKITTKQGVPGAVDTVQIKFLEHGAWEGGWSTLGFKSSDQKVHSFFGTAMDFIHLDEPTEENVYNECLLRTMTTGGYMMHTVTPKSGMTPMLSTYLADCDLMAGAEELLSNLALARAIMEQERAGDSDED